ncbi:ATP-binding cassette domain-containing protein, partial [Kitasatospora sp. NPDC048722]|uniref:ATP-binding cassette domain-containing protein n=1 Tax=Kitasatospora sp. NPDC048722 TaxID=3155639 RepID=UPI00341146B3
MNSLISLEKVNYQIADQHILHDVDWQIPAGAHITLTGPSGGGKSTLLRIIAAMISKNPAVTRGCARRVSPVHSKVG